MDWRQLKGLPTSLLALFALCSVLPLVSFLVSNFPAVVLSGRLGGIIVLLTYWIIPLALAASIARRSLFLIPLFYLQCTALLVHASIGLIDSPSEMRLVQLLIVVTMAHYSFVLLGRDAIYPLLSKEMRTWRTTPRVPLQTPVTLWYHDSHTRLSCKMTDVSLGGLSIEADRREFEAFLHEKNLLSNFILYVGYREKQWLLNVKLVHRIDSGTKQRAGIQVLNNNVMPALMRATAGHVAESPRSVRVYQYWARLGFRQAAFVGWALALFVLLCVPSCVRRNQSLVEYRMRTTPSAPEVPHPEPEFSP